MAYSKKPKSKHMYTELPKTINHSAHNLHLVLRVRAIFEGYNLCDASGDNCQQG
jgi:hypothetical protein